MLTEALGREPTDEELADEIGVAPPQARPAPGRPPTARPRWTRRSTKAKPPSIGEVISDERAVNPLDMLSDKNLHGELDGLLSVLDERERRIIDERFGLDGRKALTLEEVGREFGVTRERIRQLQNSALTKMRRALRKKEKPLPKPLRCGLCGSLISMCSGSRCATAAESPPRLSLSRRQSLLPSEQSSPANCEFFNYPLASPAPDSYSSRPV